MYKWLIVVGLSLSAAGGAVFGQNTISSQHENPQNGSGNNRTAEEWLIYFSENWSAADWVPEGKARFSKYILSPDSKGWKIRFETFQGLVKLGNKAIPALLEELESTDTDRRILAAQTLGYLGENVPVDLLREALDRERDAAVKLYLIDSLAMLGQGASLDVDALMKKEPNRDIKMHLSYLILRKEASLDSAVRQVLTDWNPLAIDSAKIGKLAPDFELISARNKKVQLSSFRGKKAVVLVFVYGDT